MRFRRARGLIYAGKPGGKEIGNFGNTRASSHAIRSDRVPTGIRNTFRDSIRRVVYYARGCKRVGIIAIKSHRMGVSLAAE